MDLIKDDLGSESNSLNILRFFQRIKSVRVGPLYGWGFLGTCLVIAIFLILAGVQASQPYVIDEAAFPYGAEGILREGAPYFYNGETRPRDLGLWHPPLYIYSLAFHMFIFGTSRFSVRAFGMIMVLVAYAISLGTIQRAAPRLSQFGYVVFAALFLCNPLVLSGALIPDIDGTIGMVATAAMIWFATCIIQDRFSWRLFAISGAVCTLVISTKFTLAFLFIPLLLTAAFISKDDKIRKFLLVLGSAGIGLVLFLMGYFLLSKAAGFPAQAPFDYILSAFQRTQGGAGILEKILGHLGSGGGVIFFLTIGLLSSGIAGGLFVLSGCTTDVDARPAAFFLLTSLYLVLGYSAITGSVFTFPKYWGIAALPLSINAALMFSRKSITRPLLAVVNQLQGWPSVLILLIAIAPVGWGYIHLSRQLEGGVRDISLLLWVTFFAFLVYAAELAFVTGWLLGKYKSIFWSALMGSSVVALVFAAITIQFSVDIMHSFADYSTRYYFSERGLDDVIQYLRSETEQDSYIIAAKDVGLQSGRRFYEDAAFLTRTPDEFRILLRDTPATYLVTRKKWDYSNFVYPAQFEVIPEYFVPIPHQPAEDFIVWIRKQVK